MKKLTQPEKQRLWNDACYKNRQSMNDAAMDYADTIIAEFFRINNLTVETQPAEPCSMSLNDKDTGGPAFPLSNSHHELTGTNWEDSNGMTMRDYFAAKAMQGIVSDPSWRGLVCNTAAKTAYEIADAMLKARTE